MTNNNESKLGFTQVWEGKPTEFIPVSRQWASVKEDHLIVESASYPGNLILWVANEWIDWCHLRIMGQFRPTNIYNTRMESKRSFNNEVKGKYSNEVEPVSPITGLTYAEEESQSCWGDSGMEGRL
jgi:hypothetical protein